VVTTSIGLGTLAALVVSADAISGERERGTLETLLVTPLDRRDLVIGKLLAATTMWGASLLTTLPFVLVLAHGPGVVVDAVIALIVAGALVAATLTALGLVVSIVAGSNRASLVGAVAALLLLAAPSQLPAVKAGGPLGSALLAVDPVSAGLTFANDIVVGQQPWPGQTGYLLSPLFAALALTALAVWLSRRIELGGTP
jgi:ABC-2 type transport system permease protein